MVKREKDGSIYIKILYWGCSRSGKTTAVDTLYRLTQQKYSKFVKPAGDLKKLAMQNGSTLYFDRGIFQSQVQKKIFYHVYTVAGQTRFFPLRKKIFAGTDGVVYMMDGQRSRIGENLDSLKELKRVAEGNLIRKIPFIVLVNKQDLPKTMKKNEVIEILRKEDLYFDPPHPLAKNNPIIYETIALYDSAQNIYQSYKELARRVAIYHAYGPL